MDPATADVSMADMDYKGAFSMGKTAARLALNIDAFTFTFRFTFIYVVQRDSEMTTATFEVKHDKAKAVSLLPLQVKLCMAGFCGTLSKT